MEPVESFGNWVRVRRQLLQLSRDELAGRVGCAPITLRKIEADERRPSAQVAERLAGALELPAGLHGEFVRAARAEVQIGRLAAPDQIAVGAGAAPARGNLPVPRTALIGRARESALLRQYLLRPDVALLTVTGAPGVGKTRLSLHAAAAAGDAFADGVWFVPLTPVREPQGAIALIAQALGVKERAAQPLAPGAGGADGGAAGLFDALKTYCRGKRLLLLLDNVEQVAGVAALLTELLAAAPQLKLLATSRAALLVSSEQELAVAPLALPDPAAPALAALQRVASVELFVQRAQASRADFALSEDNAGAVAEICRRLDGLPLAIELAAARIKVLTPEALLARLASRLRLLTDGMRDMPDRHQTLRAAIAWSYDLLDAEEQRLFRWLGVFRGGFELEAAETVCGGGALSVLDLLASLVSKSLVQRRASREGELRFDLLETIREYALEQLALAGEDEPALRRHAVYYRQLAQEAEAQLQGPRQIAWLDRLAAEHDNLRAALSQARERHDRELALQLGAALWLFWQVRGLLSEGRAWTGIIIDMSAGMATLERMQVLNGAGMLAFSQSDLARAEALCSASLALARELGDREGIAHALSSLGTIATGSHDLELALARCAESLALSRGLGLHWLSGWALVTTGYVLLEQGEDERALVAILEGLELFRSIGGARGSASALMFLAHSAQNRGDAAQSERYAEEARALCGALRDWQSLAYANESLAYAARARGDDGRAAALLEESLALLAEQGETWRAAWVQISLSRLASARGDARRAAALLAQGVAVARQFDDPELLALAALSAAELALAHGDDARALRLLAAGQAQMERHNFQLRGPDASDYRQAVAALEGRLDGATCARCRAEGLALPGDAAVAAVLALCAEHRGDAASV